MKKKTLLMITAFVVFNFTNAQNLYFGNFDSYTVGNLSNDPSGQMPGQGNWYTKILSPDMQVRVVQEPGRGNILGLGWLNGQKVPPVSNDIRCTGFSSLWSNRTVGNNIFKLEFDFFIDDISPNSEFGFTMHVSGPNNAILTQTIIQFSQNDLFISGGPTALGKNTQYPTGKWVRFELYLDYDTYKAYYYFPSLNALFTDNFMNITTPAPIADMIRMGFYISNTTYAGALIRMDDFKISAVSKLPFLDVKDPISQKFNLYPNPATNVVNISANELIPIKQVTVYDVAGNKVQSFVLNNEAETHLNVEHLAKGSYILHIQTSEGTAVKKLVIK